MSRRVLLVTPDFPPATGGIQRLLGELVRHANGWDAHVHTLAAGSAPDSDHAATMCLGLRPLPQQARIAALNAVAVRAGLAVRPAAVIAGHVVTSPAANALGHLLGVPTVQYAYGTELTHRRRMTSYAVRRASATIAISEHTAELVRAAGAAPADVRVIIPGVDPARAAQSAGAGPPTILTVARLADRYKGFDVMMRAMPLVRARVPRVRWVVVGDGPLRPALERLAAAWGLGDAVLLPGRVSATELERWYSDADVFAMPSRVPPDGGGEGYGLVYLEAGAHGLPCLAGDEGATAEAVICGETGLLVPARDHDAVARGLIELLTDRQRALALGAAGRRRAGELSWERMARVVERFVGELIERSHKGRSAKIAA